MRCLVVGGGGREHALVWALDRSPIVDKIFVAPGNGGMQTIAESVSVDSADIARLLRFAVDTRIDLTIVGPEAPLVAGLADSFREAGLAVFGPDRQAARLEGSKSFCKQFMKRHNVPTAEFRICDDPAAARAAVRDLDRVVVKADGLAAGKGVFVVDTFEEADEAIQRLMINQEFGEAGLRVVIERRLEGREVSLMVVADGNDFVVLPSARDYKRLLTGDDGPNTGGMGVVSPVPDWTSELLDCVIEDIIHPTLEGMKEEGSLYRGVLYAGLMLSDGKPYVLEYNCRFGDPETQVVLPRLGGDVAELLKASANGSLKGYKVDVIDDCTVGVVMASGGYPHKYPIGVPIRGVDQVDRNNVIVFHSGTRTDGDKLVTSGGRVLTVVGFGHDVKAAAGAAYKAVNGIDFAGKHFRCDIGQ